MCTQHTEHEGIKTHACVQNREQEIQPRDTRRKNRQGFTEQRLKERKAKRGMNNDVQISYFSSFNSAIMLFFCSGHVNSTCWILK